MEIAIFKEVTTEDAGASELSLSQRKLVYGHGINDSEYMVTGSDENGRVRCPYYQRWVAMLERVYSARYHEKKPTYIDCSVSDEWLVFSAFRSWMVEQDWRGKELDKDLLIQGNKHYSKETCLFVTPEINKLLIDNKASRGKYPAGVCFHKRNKSYQSCISVDGHKKCIGYYPTPELASAAYKSAKYAVIKDIALQQTEPLKSALMEYKL